MRAGPKPQNCILKGVKKKRCTSLHWPLGTRPNSIERKGPSLEHKAVLTNPLGDGKYAGARPCPENLNILGQARRAQGAQAVGLVPPRPWQQEPCLGPAPHYVLRFQGRDTDPIATDQRGTSPTTRAHWVRQRMALRFLSHLPSSQIATGPPHFFAGAFDLKTYSETLSPLPQF